MFVRFVPAVLACALLPLVAGCGSSGAAGGAAAAVPEDVAVYVSLDTSFEGDQWRAVSDLLGKFPDGEGTLESFLDEATAEAGLEGDVELRDAVGPEVAVAILSGPIGTDGEPPVVILTQPDDVDAFQELLDSSDGTVHAEVNGWQALASSEAALEAYRDALAGPSLEDSDVFADTMDDLPGNALAHLYVNGEALAEAVPELGADLQQSPFGMIPGGGAGSVGAVLRAEGNGLRVEGRMLSTGGESLPQSEPYEAELTEEVPAGAIAFLSFNDLGSALEEYGDLLGGAGAAGILGFDLADLGALFAGETAVYVSPGSPEPAVTLVTQVEDEAAALQSVEALVGLAGEELPIAYEAFDGLLAVSSSQEELDALRGDGPRLDQDDAFEEALDAAGMPDETTGFAYVDVQGIVPLFLGLGTPLGAEAEAPSEYLEPLGGVVLWGSNAGDVQRFTVFLGID